MSIDSGIRDVVGVGVLRIWPPHLMEHCNIL